MISSSPTSQEECRRCGLRNAQGTEMIYEDGAIDWKCDACGGTARMGYVEDSQLKQMEDKRGRELAEANRDRYRREKDEEITKRMQDAQFYPEDAPNPLDEYHKTLNPNFSPQY